MMEDNLTERKDKMSTDKSQRSRRELLLGVVPPGRGHLWGLPVKDPRCVHGVPHGPGKSLSQAAPRTWLSASVSEEGSLWVNRCPVECQS